MCLLWHSACSTARWTKSLSDTNNPPTPRSVASLERCQVHWMFVLWGDPSSVWLARWLGAERRSLWSPLLTMTPLLTASAVTHGEATGQHTGPNSNSITLSSGAFTGHQTDYSSQWWERASVNYRLLLLLRTWATVFSSVTEWCVMSDSIGVKCLWEGVNYLPGFCGVCAKISPEELHLYTVASASILLESPSFFPSLSLPVCVWTCQICLSF